jgi:hypothetical protein
MSALRALAITPAAQAWLAQAGPARVLNVFDRACNLVNAAGQVLAVVTTERGLTPFALVVAAEAPAPFRALTETSLVRVAGSELRLGPYAIDTTSAQPWDPRPNWTGIRRALADPAPLEALAALAQGRGPAGSLLELFEYRHTPAAAWMERAWQGAGELVVGLRAGELETALRGAGRLAGLGGGLTPAGDDFVLGALLGLWAGLYGRSGEGAGELLAEAAAARTTTLSAAYLRAAARGECSAYWQRLLAALCAPDQADLRPALESLLAVGHTSGADALAGFLAGRRMEYQRLTLPGGR